MTSSVSPKSAGRPNLKEEIFTLKQNYAIHAKLISTRDNAVQISEAMRHFFTFLDGHARTKQHFPVERLYEINVILRHPSINNKDEVFVTITSTLARVNENVTYWQLAATLNNVTGDFMQTVVKAEQAAGAVIDSNWPPLTHHSSLVPFLVKSA